MPEFQEILVETYTKEITSKKWGTATTVFCLFFFIGMFFWPLIIVAIISVFAIGSSPSIEKYIALKCPKCEKETLAIIPFAERYKAGKTLDFTKANNFDFQCQHCSTHMSYLNEYAIYKKIVIPSNTP